MKRSLVSRRRGLAALAYRPWMERLERRLPPGCVLSGLLPSETALTENLELEGFATNKAALAIVTDSGRVGLTRSPELIDRDESRVPLSDEPAQRRDKPTNEQTLFHASSSRAIHRHFEAGGALVMAVQFSALATPVRTSQAVDIERHGMSRTAVVGRVDTGNVAKSETPSPAQQPDVRDNYGNLPLSFEQNGGQFDERVDFVSRAGGATVFLTPTAAVFAYGGRAGGVPLEASRSQGVDTPHSPGVALHMQIVGANPTAQVNSVDQLPGITNYLLGNDPTQWHTNIASFGRVEYDEVYPGIDLAYYGNGAQQLEYDFLVSPGADPSAIALSFAGADGMEINSRGDLVLHTAVGDVVHEKPFTYQEVGNTRQEVTSGYVIQSDIVRFEVGNHDARLPLVIDPVVLGYSTFLGGSGHDVGLGIAVDGASNAYITGQTNSVNFPIKPGALDTTQNGGDAFVTKLNAAGTGLIYSTFLGGTGSDGGSGIAVDGSGFAYVTGFTTSSNFPTTLGAFDTSHNGWYDVFVSWLNPSGSGLSYSTYLGGSGPEFPLGIAFDGTSNVYITGETQSADYPTTSGAFDTTYNGGTLGDAFVTKVKLIGFTSLAYSTFLGGSGGDNGFGLALDGSGNAYVTGLTTSTDFPTTPGALDTVSNGHDAFVTKLNAAGSALDYSTYLGGIGVDFARGIALDSSGNAHVTGSTTSGDFPVTPGAFDTDKNGFYEAFVTKLNAAGSAAVYSTYLGSSEDDQGAAIQVDAGGNAFVTGETTSSDFPTTPGAFDTSNSSLDGFVSRLNATGSALAYSTYLGGRFQDSIDALAIDAGGNVYVTGETYSSNFPTSHSAFDTTFGAGVYADAFVSKLRVIATPCGCFKARTITTAANGAVDVFAADMDRDGDMDVLSASNQDDMIVWYENKGNGSFIPRTISTLDTTNNPDSIFATDVDGDGDTDVLSASNLDDKIAWHENDGNQNFTAHTITNTFFSDNPQGVFAADMDNDGDTDVLSASFANDFIVLHQNNGDKTFTNFVIATANGPNSVFAADVDGDGDNDALTASLYDDKIAWHENKGNTVFTHHTITTAANGANAVFAIDMDKDGDIDVLSSSFIDNKIAWYENNGIGTFTTRVITTTFASSPQDVFAVDIDADGDIDVVSASNVDDKIAWYRNDGNQNFTGKNITKFADNAGSVFAADMDGDGDQDVLSASFSDDKIAWYENRNGVALAEVKPI